MNGFERFDTVYPATTNGFLLFILSLAHPETPFKTLASAVVIPAIKPKTRVGFSSTRSIINKGKILWIISLETSVKKDTSPIIKTGIETPKKSFVLRWDLFSSLMI